MTATTDANTCELTPIKRGETLELFLTYTDANNVPKLLDNIHVSCQVRDAANKLVADLAYCKGIATGEYTLTCNDTSRWKPGQLRLDIKYVNENKVSFTDTLTLMVGQSVTL